MWERSHFVKAEMRATVKQLRVCRHRVSLVCDRREVRRAIWFSSSRHLMHSNSTRVWVEIPSHRALMSVLGGGEIPGLTDVVPGPCTYHDDGRKAILLDGRMAVTGDGDVFESANVSVPVSLSWNMWKGGTRNMGVLTIRSPCIMIDDPNMRVDPYQGIGTLTAAQLALTRTDAWPDEALLKDLLTIN